MIVSLFASSSIVHPCLRSFVDDCRFLLQRIPQTKIKHVFKEANKHVDGLADLGRSQEVDFVLFDFSPCG